MFLLYFVRFPCRCRNFDKTSFSIFVCSSRIAGFKAVALVGIYPFTGSNYCAQGKQYHSLQVTLCGWTRACDNFHKFCFYFELGMFIQQHKTRHFCSFNVLHVSLQLALSTVFHKASTYVLAWIQLMHKIFSDLGVALFRGQHLCKSY